MELRDFSKLYFGLLVLHLAVIYKPESQVLYLLSKPALPFSILAYFIHRSPQAPSKFRYPLILAFTFLLLGDILLLQKGDAWHAPAIGAFAFAQLAFIGFYTSQRPKGKSILLATAALVFISLFVLVQNLTIPQALYWPAFIFCGAMGTHLIAALLFSKDEPPLQKFLAPGVLLLAIGLLLVVYSHTWLQMGSRYLSMSAVLAYALGNFLLLSGVLRKIDSVETQ